jgi:hypothetical protein
MRIFVGVSLLLTARLLTAAPQILSVTPDHGPSSGGTTVTIKGSGFETCPICSPPLPPTVSFGGTQALSTTLIDSSTLVAVTPPMLPLPTDVTVYQWNGEASVPNGFTYTGDPGYEAILLPIYSPPISGAFGSEFITEVTAANRSEVGVSILGIDESCFITSPPSPGPFVPRTIEAGVGRTREISTNCSDWPARLLYLRSGETDRASFNIRVHDTSRNASSHGTSIPVVRQSDFTTKPIVLPGVPYDPRFRVTLRVYALEGGVVLVSVNDLSTPLQLQPGSNAFEPAYGQMTIPNPAVALPGTFTISIVPPSSPVGPPPGLPNTYRYWAFITVTNNDTQEITTITPDL